jgi:ABC-type multidrug transport system fused ATPase/permease subunit
LNEIPKSIKTSESNSTEKLKRSLAGEIIDLFGQEATLFTLSGIIVVETIFISIILFVIIKFYRNRSNNSNNQPQIPGTINLNLAEYAQPRDFFRVSTDSHFYAEVGTELKKGEPVYEEVDKSKR